MVPVNFISQESCLVVVNVGIEVLKSVFWAAGSVFSAV